MLTKQPTFSGKCDFWRYAQNLKPFANKGIANRKRWKQESLRHRWICRRLRGVVEIQFNPHAPFLKQPFGNIDTIPVALAPKFQLGRRDIRLRGESQPSDLDLELGVNNWRWPQGKTPIRISAARHIRESVLLFSRV